MKRRASTADSRINDIYDNIPIVVELHSSTLEVPLLDGSEVLGGYVAWRKPPLVLQRVEHVPSVRVVLDNHLLLHSKREIWEWEGGCKYVYQCK